MITTLLDGPYHGAKIGLGDAPDCIAVYPNCSVVDIKLEEVADAVARGADIYRRVSEPGPPVFRVFTLHDLMQERRAA